MAENRFMTVEETAEFIRRTPKAVRHMLARKQLPGASKMKGRWIVDRKYVCEWIENNRVEHIGM